MKTYALQVCAPSDAEAVSHALSDEIASDFGPRDETPLAVVAREEDGALIGGLLGSSHWRWCYIRQFWVDAGWRDRGVGAALLARAEDEARARGCVGLYLDTFNPDARRFYERHGFCVVGTIPNFPPGHARTFLVKRQPEVG